MKEGMGLLADKLSTGDDFRIMKSLQVSMQ